MFGSAAPVRFGGMKDRKYRNDRKKRMAPVTRRLVTIRLRMYAPQSIAGFHRSTPIGMFASHCEGDQGEPQHAVANSKHNATADTARRAPSEVALRSS